VLAEHDVEHRRQIARQQQDHQHAADDDDGQRSLRLRADAR
jgi:hypothetical protein